MDTVLGFPAIEHADGFLLRLVVAVMLGGLLGTALTLLVLVLRNKKR